MVLVSGGLDSATVLAMAVDRGLRCHALSFDYGQRHRRELEAAAEVAGFLGAYQHRVARLDIGWMGGSALTDQNIDVPQQAQQGIPITYVPARNTIFLAVALGWAEVLGAQDIYIGANAVDYSGYPDCRPEFVEAFQRLANLATQAGVEGEGFRIQAPLVRMSKADIIRVGTDLGVDFSKTVSCYALDDNGAACGVCDSCRLRAEGFRAAGIPDPTKYTENHVGNGF